MVDWRGARHTVTARASVVTDLRLAELLRECASVASSLVLRSGAPPALVAAHPIAAQRKRA
jgi:hypothetical protein